MKLLSCLPGPTTELVQPLSCLPGLTTELVKPLSCLPGLTTELVEPLSCLPGPTSRHLRDIDTCETSARHSDRIDHTFPFRPATKIERHRVF